MVHERRADVGDAGRGDVLIVRTENQNLRLQGRGTWLLGRGAESDVVLNSPAVSRIHGSIIKSEWGWQYRDHGSTNGTWQGERRVYEVPIGASPVSLLLGGHEGGAEVVIFCEDQAQAEAHAQAQTLESARLQPAGVGAAVAGLPGPAAPPMHHADIPSWADPVSTGPMYELPVGSMISIGRALDNDIVIEDLMVSRQHAVLRVDPHGVQLIDRGSDNGTYVRGVPILQQWLRQGDTFAIGPCLFWLDGPNTLVQVNQERDARFGARGLSVRLGDGRTLLHDINLTLPPRSLMAVIGPSGSGKSTLLGALTGLRPATSGTVTYAGQDLYRDYVQLRQRIGFVPQDDILHTSLTVEQALTFGAELRFPKDTKASERKARVREVAAELQLTERLETPISRLSGGERKRASTALELLTGAALLFLDEPTSGLDTDLDREVMRLLRRLADDGRTVVVVSHNLEHLDACDTVMLLARGGHVAYLGPPDGVFDYFGVRSWADVFATLKTHDGAGWAQRFRQWPGRGPTSQPLTPHAWAVGARTATAEELRVGKASGMQQLRTLIRRQIRVTMADRTLVAMLIALPIVLAAIARAVPGEHGLMRSAANSEARQLLLVLIVGASLLGSAAAVRDLVSERAIYRRERAVGLSSSAYLASKVLVLAALTAVQGVVLTMLALAGRRPPTEALLLPSPTAEIALVVAVVAAVSSGVGLMISAAVREENQAMPLLVLWNMAQLVLCGALVPIVGRFGLEQLSWLLPARWGFSAVASTTGLNSMGPPAKTPDPTWDHVLTTWLTDMVALGVLAVLAVGIAGVLTRRLDPSFR